MGPDGGVHRRIASPKRKVRYRNQPSANRSRKRPAVEHALADAKALRTGNADADLLTRLAGERRIGLVKRALQVNLSENPRFYGAAPHQVDPFLADVKPLAK